MKVATEDRHMMTHLAYVHSEEGEKQIVSLCKMENNGMLVVNGPRVCVGRIINDKLN